MKLYVRVFEKRRTLKKIFNKTYDLKDYGDYLAMMSEIRKGLWQAYVEKAGRSRTKSRPGRSRPARASGLIPFYSSGNNEQ